MPGKYLWDIQTAFTALGTLCLTISVVPSCIKESSELFAFQLHQNNKKKIKKQVINKIQSSCRGSQESLCPLKNKFNDMSNWSMKY